MSAFHPWPSHARQHIAVGIGVLAAIFGASARAACAQPLPTETVTVTTRGDSLTRDTLTATLRDGARAATRYTLRVPELRSNSTSRRITIRWLRFARTTDATPAASGAKAPGATAPPPIVFLAGGPGDAATRAFATMPVAFLDSLRTISDVIAFDQRATGQSQPLLICAPDAAIPFDQVLTSAQRDSSARSTASRCLATVIASGVQPAGYTTAESVDDLESLRTALGVPTLSFLGGSYGTHLGLAYVRQHPTHTARVVLAGVEGPDDTFKLPSRVDAAFVQLAQLVAADSAFRGREDLLKVFDRTRARLAREPMFATLNGTRIALTEFDLQRLVTDALGDLRLLQALPSQLYAIDSGRTDALARTAVRMRQPRPINAMNLLVNCASGASVARQSQIDRERRASRLGTVIDFPATAMCTADGMPRLPEAFRAPATNPSAVLMVSGSLDGRTPPVNAEVLLTFFGNARHLIIDYQSHSLMGDPDVFRATLNFLRGVDVPGSRITRLPPPFTRSSP